MKLRKSIALILCLALCAGGVAGCSGSKTASGGKVSFSVGDWPSKEGESLNVQNEIKASFEEKYPEYTVVPDTWTFSLDTFYPKAAVGQLPNLYHSNFTEIPNIISGEYSEDITDSLKKNGYYDLLNKKLLDIVEKDGRVYSYPYYAYTLGVAYNVSLFEKAGLMNDDATPMVPKTWDELAEFAVKIKDATGVKGFIFPTSGNCGGWMFTPLAWSYGVKFMEKDDSGKWVATFDTPECVQALQYVKDLKWKYDVVPDATNIDFKEMYSLYCTGRGAMLLSSSDLAGSVYNYEMDINVVGMFPIPAGPEKHVTLLGGKVYNVASGSSKEQIDGCVKYLEYLGVSPVLTDAYKKAKEATMNRHLGKGYIVGIKQLSCFNEDSETYKYDNELIDKNRNTEENHYILYNNSLTDLSIEIQSEEPVCSQELYSVLDTCIQKVLTDKDADCSAIIKEACRTFQSNYLNNFAY